MPKADWSKITLSEICKIKVGRRGDGREFIDPKKATAKHQPIRASGDKMIGSEPSRFGDNWAKAGKMPTKPAANGMVPIAVAVVWSKIWKRENTCMSAHVHVKEMASVLFTFSLMESGR